MSRRSTLREFEHDADVGFEIEAHSLDELFELAGLGLTQALGLLDAEARGSGEAEEIVLERPDLERLLVAWLRELLVTAQVERATPFFEGLSVGTHVPSAQGGRFGLTARVRWTSGEGPTREVKAVTYHGLRVERRGDMWCARVLFDV